MRFTITLIASALMVATPILAAPELEPRHINFAKWEAKAKQVGSKVAHYAEEAAPVVLPLALDAFRKRENGHTELFERSFDENDLFERDVEEDLFERDFDESELMERDIEGEELMERDFDESELMERDFDDSELFEREFGDEELEALERRMTKAQFKQDAHKFGKGLEEFGEAAWQAGGATFLDQAAQAAKLY